MVRRDDDRNPGPSRPGNLASRCEDPAGASPVSVSGNAPSSRLPAPGEILASEAEHQEPENRREPPLTGRQARGPQLEVKTAASSNLQSERVGWEPTGRAAHVTAKATLTARDKRVEGLGGVGVAARVQGSARNTREPSAQPSSRQGASYKPKAKSNTAQRKSEGTIVPIAPA